MKTVKLGDVCNILNGYAFKSDSYVEEGIRVIRIANVQKGYIEDNNPVFYPLDSKGLERYMLKEQDLLMSLTGNVGRVALIEREMLPAALNQRVACLRLKSDTILRKYLFHLLNSNFFEQQCMKASKGVAQKNISTEWIKEYEIPLYSIEKQQEIIRILDKTRYIISAKMKEIRMLDNLIKARFVELFGDAIHNDKGWENDTVEKLCKEIYGGGTPSKSHPEYYEDGDIPWVSSKDMKTDVLTDSQIKINQLGVDNSTARMVPINSVIMVIRSGILKHTLPVAINAVPITVNQDLKVFIPNERVLTRFLAIQFKMHEKDILSGVRAVTADNIEFNSLKQRELIVPPIELQQEYVTFLEQIDKSKVAVQKSLDETQLLFDSLMQKYFG